MSRVTEIRYVGYAVADLAAERAFYAQKWGLKEVREENGLVYFAAQGHDELFVVLDGTFHIELEDRRTIELEPRQGFCVPAGLHHRPIARRRACVLMCERAGFVPTGDG